MLEENIIFLGTPIDDYVANAVCAQLLYLEYKNADKDISLYINSPGGDITALFAIYDTMKFVKNDISTFCYGQAASAAAVLLAGGHQGQALRPAPRPDPDPPALRRRRRPGRRHRDPGQGDPAHAGPAQRDAGPRHRPGGREVAKDTDRDFIMSADEAEELRHHRRGHHHPRAGGRSASRGRRLKVRGERAWRSSERAATW